MLSRIAAGATQPDLTLILDIDAAVGPGTRDRAPRSRWQTAAADPYEQRSLAFHERLRQGYWTSPGPIPTRCRVIDATGTPEAVEQRVREAVLGRFGSLLAAKAR